MEFLLCTCHVVASSCLFTWRPPPQVFAARNESCVCYEICKLRLKQLRANYYSTVVCCLMSSSAEQFEMMVGIGPTACKVTAVLRVVRSKSQHADPEDGWKAHIAIPGNSKQPRLFGNWRNTITDTVNALLEKHSHNITKAEVLRLSKLAVVLQSRLSFNLVTSGSSSQPNTAVATASLSITKFVPLSQEKQRGTCVYYVHQIYGLVGDDTPMSELFQKSQKMWRDVAASMGATYHLWNAAEIESLMKMHYPNYWAMYCDVPYPAMRCGIGRLAILHRYGGLYSDMDCMPNRAWYGQTEFALSRVKKLPKLGRAGTPKLGISVKKTIKKKRMGLITKSKTASRVVDKYNLDMKVIIGSMGNIVFLDWLAYVHQEIARTPYAHHRSFLPRMRYVIHTTGSNSMNRFLTKYRNDVHADIKYLECNYFKEVDSLSENRKRLFDVISHPSQSYFKKELAIHVPVGLGGGSLPLLPTTKRMRVKSANLRMGVSEVGSDCHVSESTRARQATSTDEDAGVGEVISAASIDSKAEVAVNSISDMMADLLVDCMATAFEKSQAKLECLADEWDGLESGSTAIKQHYLHTLNTATTRTHFISMPRPLIEWLVGVQVQ